MSVDTLAFSHDAANAVERIAGDITSARALSLHDQDPVLIKIYSESAHKNLAALAAAMGYTLTKTPAITEPSTGDA